MLDDDVQAIVSPSPSPDDLDPRVVRSRAAAARARPCGRADDAVALDRCRPDDLGAGVARDRDPPESERRRVTDSTRGIRPDGAAAAVATAFVTLPAFRQRVQTYARVGVPPTMMRTRWRLGLKRRLVATIEWLRLLPNPGFFPQTEQIFDIGRAV